MPIGAQFVADLTFDQQWAAATNQAAAARAERLEAALVAEKKNASRERVCAALLECGDFAAARGDFAGASQVHTRGRVRADVIVVQFTDFRVIIFFFFAAVPRCRGSRFIAA